MPTKASGVEQCRGVGVGHLDTFHLPGYAVGPFLVTNVDYMPLDFQEDGRIKSFILRNSPVSGLRCWRCKRDVQQASHGGARARASCGVAV